MLVSDFILFLQGSYLVHTQGKKHQSNLYVDHMAKLCMYGL